MTKKCRESDMSSLLKRAMAATGSGGSCRKEAEVRPPGGKLLNQNSIAVFVRAGA